MKTSTILFLFASLAALATSTTAVAQDVVGDSYVLRGHAELGTLSVIDHNVQFSRGNTDFDYDTQGGQDNLFFISRWSLDLDLGPRHKLVFLYQPLELKTRVTLKQDLVVDNVTFDAGTPMLLTYGFPFTRASYLYDFASGPRHELALGGSLQIRNATINFQTVQGDRLVSNRDVGPVPLLKARGRYGFENGAWAGFEVDGIYAPISVINGSTNETVGALIDASVRLGVDLRQDLGAFLNLRYLAGGAVGDSEDGDGQGDGYSRNWLHFATVTVGLEFAVGAR